MATDRDDGPRAEGRFTYALHNFIGHPLMGFCMALGLRQLADRIHDATLPSVRQ